MVKAQSTIASRTSAAIQRDKCFDIVPYLTVPSGDRGLAERPRSVGSGGSIGDIKIRNDGPMIARSSDIG